MEPLFTALAAALLGISIYLLTRHTLLRVVLGLTLLTNAVNLLLLAQGRITSLAPSLLPAGETSPPNPAENPLAQAFALTAVVIGLGVLAFALALARRVEESSGTVVPDELPAADRLRAAPLERLQP